MDVKSIKEKKAEVEIWQYVFGFTPMALVKCAIELGIGGAVSLPLGRIMRYLTHRGFFELNQSTNKYSNTPLSLLLSKSGANTIAPLLVMEAGPQRRFGIQGRARGGTMGLRVPQSGPEQAIQ